MRTQIPGSQILDQGVKTEDIEDNAVTDDKLSSTGVGAGTFTKVEVNDKGRVVSAENPTTLAGYGITDAQPVDADLTALAGIGTTGLYVVTGPGTSVTRTLVQPAAGLTITNPAGLAANITFALSNDLLALEGLAGTGFAVRTGTDAWAQRTITGPASGITVTNGSGVAGNPTIALANDLAGLEGLITTGLATRTGDGTWVTRSIVGTAGRIVVATGDAVAGAPTLDLATVGTVGTYASVTTDAYGRVTSGSATQLWSTITSTPTTIVGYGITDAQPLDGDLTAIAAFTGTGFAARTGTDAWAQRTLTAGSTKVSITNGAGIAGNPTIDVAEANLTLNNIGGTLGTTKGGTGLTGVGAANSVLGVNAGATGLEYKSLVQGSGISITHGIGTLTIGASLNLDALTDVIITTPSNGNVLSYNGTNWVNTTVAASSASGVLSTWTLVSDNRYYSDFTHSLGTNNIVITLYDTSNNTVVTADEITLTNTNTVRVQVIGNSRTIRIVVVANGYTVNTGAQSAGTIITAKDGVNVSTASGRLNFTGQAVSVADAGSGTTNITIGSRFTFFAGAFDTPNNSDWAINALAPTVADPSFGSLSVRQFSNTVEQGVGFLLSVPDGATSITFKFRGRAATAPVAVSNVQPRVYARLIPNGSVIGAWSAAQNLSSIAIPTNAFFQYANQTVALAALGMTAGNTYQIELTRNTGVASNLAANFLLAELTVEIA